MPTMVGILTFMSRGFFVLSRVEYGKSFITSGPGTNISQRQLFSISKGHNPRSTPYRVTVQFLGSASCLML